MTQPYNVKDLGLIIREKAAAKGLILAEEAVESLAVAAYEGLKEWFNQSAQLSPNPVDNFIAPAIGYLDGYVLPQIEKIDIDGDGK